MSEQRISEVYGYVRFLPGTAQFVMPVFVMGNSQFVAVAKEQVIEEFVPLPAEFASKVIEHRVQLAQQSRVGDLIIYGFEMKGEVFFGDERDMTFWLRKLPKTIGETAPIVDRFLIRHSGDQSMQIGVLVLVPNLIGVQGFSSVTKKFPRLRMMHSSADINRIDHVANTYKPLVVVVDISFLTKAKINWKNFFSMLGSDTKVIVLFDQFVLHELFQARPKRVIAFLTRKTSEDDWTEAFSRIFNRDEVYVSPEVQIMQNKSTGKGNSASLMASIASIFPFMGSAVGAMVTLLKDFMNKDSVKSNKD